MKTARPQYTWAYPGQAQVKFVSAQAKFMRQANVKEHAVNLSIYMQLSLFNCCASAAAAAAKRTYNQ